MMSLSSTEYGATWKCTMPSWYMLLTRLAPLFAVIQLSFPSPFFTFSFSNYFYFGNRQLIITIINASRGCIVSEIEQFKCWAIWSMLEDFKLPRDRENRMKSSRSGPGQPARRTARKKRKKRRRVGRRRRRMKSHLASPSMIRCRFSGGRRCRARSITGFSSFFASEPSLEF